MATKRKPTKKDHKPKSGNGGDDSPIIIGDSSTDFRHDRPNPPFIFIRAFSFTPTTPNQSSYTIPLSGNGDTIDQVIIPGLSSINTGSFQLTLTNGVTVNAFGSDGDITINVPAGVNAVVQPSSVAHRMELKFPGSPLASVIAIGPRTQSTSISSGEQIQITLNTGS